MSQKGHGRPERATGMHGGHDNATLAVLHEKAEMYMCLLCERDERVTGRELARAPLTGTCQLLATAICIGKESKLSSQTNLSLLTHLGLSLATLASRFASKQLCL